MLTKEEAIKRRAEGLRKHYLTHESILKGRPHTPEHRRKIGLANKGKKHPITSVKFKGAGNPNWKGDKIETAQGGRTRAEVMYSCPKGLERHHKDGNTLNNSPENIEFISRREHMIKDGRLENLIKRNKGEPLPTSQTAK